MAFAVTRLPQFLFGRKFTPRTDQKPLQLFFNQKNQIHKVVSARLARRAKTLMAFGYDVIYTLGQDIGHADAMSRSRFEDDKGNLVAVAFGYI